jgi:hypothetical protein
MSVLVVFESMWGNSRQVAEAAAEGLGKDVPVVSVAEAPVPLPLDVDTLVLGGPTHAFSMSRASTRQEARAKGADEGDVTSGIREWLDALPTHDHLRVAIFDTRVASVRHLPGSAAKAAAREVRRSRLGQVIATQSFYVADTAGPLLDGELERARGWGASLQGERRTPSPAPDPRHGQR